MDEQAGFQAGLLLLLTRLSLASDRCTVTLFLCRADAWADGYEVLAELPPLLLLLHLPFGSSAAASWMPAGLAGGAAAAAAVATAGVGSVAVAAVARLIEDGARSGQSRPCNPVHPGCKRVCASGCSRMYL